MENTFNNLFAQLQTAYKNVEESVRKQEEDSKIFLDDYSNLLYTKLILL